jgi:hypothetical protein
MKQILLFALISLLIPILTGCGPRENSISEVDYLSELHTEITFHDVYDIPSKTQIEIHLNVWGEITRENLESYLWNRYDEIINSTGYDYREHPDAIYIQAYIPGKCDENWIGFIHKAAGSSGPICECRINNYWIFLLITQGIRASYCRSVLMPSAALKRFRVSV